MIFIKKYKKQHTKRINVVKISVDTASNPVQHV